MEEILTQIPRNLLEPVEIQQNCNLHVIQTTNCKRKVTPSAIPPYSPNDAPTSPEPSATSSLCSSTVTKNLRLPKDDVLDYNPDSSQDNDPKPHKNDNASPEYSGDYPDYNNHTGSYADEDFGDYSDYKNDAGRYADEDSGDQPARFYQKYAILLKHALPMPSMLQLTLITLTSTMLLLITPMLLKCIAILPLA